MIPGARQQYEYSFRLYTKELHQQSKQKWLKDGDRCTSLFYNSVKIRRERNGLFLLQGASGEEYNTRSSIVDHVLGFYQKLFGTKQHVQGFQSAVYGFGAKLLLL